MSGAASLSSGKDHRDENFPVASFLIRARHRPVILAFYRFARAADDIADNSGASEKLKLDLLEEMERSLDGEVHAAPEAAALRIVLDKHNLSPQHALDLLKAFRLDVTKRRYETLDSLMDYCRYSAMPVGRFVLDVHGEDRSLWPLSDALCSALQLINHMQDCGKDYRELNRVYIPADILAETGAEISSLGAASAPRALLAAIRKVVEKSAGLLARSRPFADAIADRRLGLEVGVIQALAEDLNLMLFERDPLRGRVHHRRSDVVGIVTRTAAAFALHRLRAQLALSSQRRG